MVGIHFSGSGCEGGRKDASGMEIIKGLACTAHAYVTRPNPDSGNREELKIG
jgi:hypothetical protein